MELTVDDPKRALLAFEDAANRTANFAHHRFFKELAAQARLLVGPESKPADVPHGELLRPIEGYPDYYISNQANIFFADSGDATSALVRIELIGAGRRARPSVLLYVEGKPKHLDVGILFKKAWPELADEL